MPRLIEGEMKDEHIMQGRKTRKDQQEAGGEKSGREIHKDQKPDGAREVRGMKTEHSPYMLLHCLT